MAIIVGSARIDERGKASGGAAGDQTGGEVSTQNYYNHSKGWRAFRAKDAGDRAEIATAMKRACSNNHIGYDQGQRNTLYQVAQGVNFDPGRVSAKCETDCSALVRVCCAYAGIMLQDFNTSSESSVLLGSGRFTEITGSVNLSTGNGLMAGDILVTRTKGHTVVVTSAGSSGSSGSGSAKTTGGMQAAQHKDGKYARSYTVTASALRIRKGAGTNFDILGTLANGTKFTCYGYYNKASDGTVWLYGIAAGITGYCSSKYLK